MKCDFLQTRIQSVFNLLKRVGFALLLWGGSVLAQTPDTLFTRTFGGEQNDWFFDVLQTSDSGMIACGFSRTWGNGEQDAYVVKTDAQGNLEWQQTYGTTDREQAVAIVAADVGYLVAIFHRVFTTGESRSETWLLRIDENGDSVSTTIYSLGTGFHIYPQSIVEAEPGYLMLAGVWTGQVWLMKVDMTGDSIWSRRYGSPSVSENTMRITNLQDGGYVLVGDARDGGFALRVNADGDSLWWFARVVDPFDEFMGVAETSDGSIVVGGVGVFDMWFVKLSADGELIWERYFGDPDLWDFCGDLLIDDQDNIWAACGHVFDFDDFILLRVSSDGDSVASGAWGGQSGDYVQRIIQLADGRIVLAGYSESYGAGLADGWLVWVDTGLPIEDDRLPVLPELLSLSAFPNPFNSTLSISLDVPLYQEVMLSLYDLLGREVDVVYRGRLSANTISYVAPAALSSGVYFLRASTNSQSVLGKVVLLK